MTNSSKAENTAARTSLQRALRESFHYDPGARPKSIDQSSEEQKQESEPDPDLLYLPKLEVKGPRVDRGFAEAIATARPTGPQNISKWGTGIHQKDFGKLRLSVVTVLFIPINAGISW